MTSFRSAALLVSLGCVCAPFHLHAADTVEGFEPGALDAEAHVSVSGHGTKASQRLGSSELVVGYGIANRVSMTAAIGVETTGTRENASEAAAGLFLGLIEAELFNWDLLAGVGYSINDSTTTLSPGFELNLNSTPHQDGVGLYLRPGIEIAIAPDGGVAAALPLELGSYAVLDGRHQLLLEGRLGVSLEGTPRPVEELWLALGYNVSLNDNFELITEIAGGSFRIVSETESDVSTAARLPSCAPKQGAGCGVSLSLGVIATFPG